MIQEIFPKKFNPQFMLKKPDANSYLLHYEYNKVMLIKSENAVSVPKFKDFDDSSLYNGAIYLFSIDNDEFYLVNNMELPEFGGFYMEGLQIFRSFSPAYLAFAGITGSQIYRWLQSRQFCGHCGHKNELSKTERALVCPNCSSVEYPKISPAIIVAITDGDRILLTRNARSTYKYYALVAGYVEIGETLEDTVRREVMEEVGLKVKNIKPYKSQPWAFSDTIMLGFTAELDGDDKITIQEEELTEAAWFNREDVPVLPFHISVGHEMIESFKKGII